MEKVSQPQLLLTPLSPGQLMGLHHLLAFSFALDRVPNCLSHRLQIFLHPYCVFSRITQIASEILFSQLDQQPPSFHYEYLAQEDFAFCKQMQILLVPSCPTGSSNWAFGRGRSCSWCPRALHTTHRAPLIVIPSMPLAANTNLNLMLVNSPPSSLSLESQALISIASWTSPPGYLTVSTCPPLSHHLYLKPAFLSHWRAALSFWFHRPETCMPSTSFLSFPPLPHTLAASWFSRDVDSASW